MITIDRSDPDVATRTPEELARFVLDSHSIQQNWVRNREQIAKLIVEAIEMDRQATDELIGNISQEQLLTLLGIDYDDGTADDGEIESWYLFPQTIEKEN